MITKLLALLFVATPAAAQTIVDGSGTGIDAEIMRSVLLDVTKEFRDPLSTQARQVSLIHPSSERPDVICGYLNAKNGFGAYVGFKPFYYDLKKKTGGVVSDAPTDISYPLQFMVLEWMGCDKELGLKRPPRGPKPKR